MSTRAPEAMRPVLVALEKIRFAKYTLVGLVPFFSNALTVLVLSYLGFSPEAAARNGFIMGGQVSFWSHDRITYRDRFPTPHGWFGRWKWFMVGQMAGFLTVYLVTGGLVVLHAADWLVLIGGLSGIPVTYTVSNRVSHRHPECPAP